MTTDTKLRRPIDRSSLVAYAGTGAAIAFIAAMTIGAIDSPPERGHWVADSQADATRMVSVAPSDDGLRVR